MAKVCEITGKRTRVGNNVSHANNRTKRKFFPNLQKKRFFIPATGEWVTLKVSTHALRMINKRGIEAVIRDVKAKGGLKDIELETKIS
jgi:large subunit ribosomal protein L28